MSRFTGPQSFGQVQPGGFSLQSNPLEKTDPMAGYGFPPSAAYPSPDPFSAPMGSMPPPPMYPDPYATTGVPGYMPPGSDPTMNMPPLSAGLGNGLSYGIPPPGSNADPYSMSSFAPGMLPPSSLSPAFTDPYAPGGAFASPPMGGNPPGTPPGFNPGAPTGSYVGAPPGPNNGNFAAGRAMMKGGPNQFRHRPIPSPPKGLPKWFKWGAGAVLLVIVGGFLIHWMRGRTSHSPAPNAPPVSAVACPPTSSCPPVSGNPPYRTEELTLRLAKDDPPLVVKVQNDRQCDTREDDDERRRDKSDEEHIPRDRRTDQLQRTSQPPVIIVNEATPSTRQIPQPPDLWEMTYASDAGSGDGPRLGDTNMVYTRVGGPL